MAQSSDSQSSTRCGSALHRQHYPLRPLHTPEAFNRGGPTTIPCLSLSESEPSFPFLKTSCFLKIANLLWQLSHQKAISTFWVVFSLIIQYFQCLKFSLPFPSGQPCVTPFSLSHHASTSSLDQARIDTQGSTLDHISAKSSCVPPWGAQSTGRRGELQAVTYV